MTNVWVRPLDEGSPEEVKLFVEWLYARRDENRFDPRLFQDRRGLSFKRVKVLVCYTSERIVGFVPLTLAFVLESLAFAPGTDAVTEAKALQSVMHYLVPLSHQQGVPRAFLTSTDQGVLDFARRYEWRDVVVDTLALEFDDLGPQKEIG